MSDLKLSDLNPTDVTPVVPAAATAAPEKPLSLSDVKPEDVTFVANNPTEAKYGGVGQQAISGLEGVARGATLGGSDVLERGLGISTPEAMLGRREANPVTSTLGQIAGNVGLTSLTGGLAAPIEGAIGAGTLGAAVGTGVEGAVLGAGNVVSDAALGDPDLNAQKAITDIGFGAAIGAVLGGAGHAIFGKAPEAIESPSIGDKLNEFATKENESARTAKALSAAEDGMPKDKEFVDMAARNGWPVVAGMNSDNPWVQRGVDSLLNGAPSYAAKQTEALYSDAYQSVSKDVDNMLGEGKLSKAEIGNSLKGSITSKISEESKPIADMYDAIKQTAQEIPISPKDMADTADEIGGIKEAKISPSSPEAKLAAKAAEEISGLKTVDDIKAYKSILNRSISPTAPSGEKRMAGIISEKLTALEENSIEAAAKNLQTDAEGAAKMKWLIQQRKVANAAYKPFIEDIKTLAERLGKGRVYGAKDAISFINDLSPEEITQRLFSKNNSEFLSFFEKKFPQESAMMREYQKGVLRDSAVSSATGEFNPKAVFRKVDNMEPEIQKAIFTPDELSKLNDAKKYIQKGFPQKFNPSGTAGKTAFQAFFESPTGALIGNARDFGIQQYIKYAGALPEAVRPNAVEAGADLANRFNKLNSIKNSSAKVGQDILDMAKNATSGSNIKTALVSAGVQGIGHSFKSRADRISKLSKDPDLMSDQMSHHTNGIMDAAPNISNGIHKTLVTGVQFLASKLPKQQDQFLLSQKIEPSEAAKNKFNRYYDAVDNPVSALKQVKNGSLSNETMEALTAVYPQMLNHMRQTVIHEMNPEKARNLPYAQKLALSKFLGQPLDASMTPMAIQANQAALAMSQQNSSTQKMKRAATSHAMDKLSLGSRSETATHRAEKPLE